MSDTIKAPKDTLRIEVIEAPHPGPSPWTEPTKHLRDISRWITGGVIATAAAVATGSSLSNLGSLDPWNDTTRLGLAAAGLIVGISAIGVIMRYAILVLNVDVASLDELADANERTLLGRIRLKIEKHYRFRKNDFKWIDVVKRDSEVGDHIERALPYFHVRMRFDRLLMVLPWATLVAILGFGLFAWAANPPDKPATPEKGLVLKITL